MTPVKSARSSAKLLLASGPCEYATILSQLVDSIGGGGGRDGDESSADDVTEYSDQARLDPRTAGLVQEEEEQGTAAEPRGPGFETGQRTAQAALGNGPQTPLDDP